MHELPVTQSLLELAIQHAEIADATRVVRLNLIIGDMATIVDESIQFYWDIIAENTIAEGAELNFNRVSTKLKCKDCGKSYQPDDKNLACPECGSLSIEIISGQEFSLASIDIEK